MSYEVRTLKAKITRRDNKIAALTEENREARAALREAIRLCKQTARENAILRNNYVVVRPGSKRVAKQMEDLRAAEATLKFIKNDIDAWNGLIRSYEAQARKTL
jgi:sialic acid synthase SpsE